MIRRDRAAIASGPASVAITGDSHAPVNTTYIGTQVLSAASMPLARAIKDPRPIFTAVGVDAFTGREWLSDEVDQFMAENPSGYVFVEAEAGLGKTAFAAWLVKTRRYLSHFSRYSGGGSVQVALANLSAQLITNFGLDDQAPGGMLPEWAQTPGGFESLLTAAAELAHERGRPVVLVVDGLDEADAPAGSLAVGPAFAASGSGVCDRYLPDRPCARTARRSDDDLADRERRSA